MDDYRYHEDPGIRIGDAEREQVSERLRNARVDGRLDDDELSDRLERAMRAKTAGELAQLMADLPGDRPRGERGSGRRSYRRWYGIPVVPTILALLVIGTASHGHAFVVLWIVPLLFIVPRLRGRRCRHRGGWGVV